MSQKIIIDHNIFYSAIRSKDSLTRQRIISLNQELYTPNFLVMELFKHRQRIVEKAKASEDEVLAFLSLILQKIHFFNEELISIENFIEAYHLCKNIDENDTTYIALTLELDGVFWTRDNVLKKGLQQKGFNRFFEENQTSNS